jgi:hypothetical protein
MALATYFAPRFFTAYYFPSFVDQTTIRTSEIARHDGITELVLLLRDARIFDSVELSLGEKNNEQLPRSGINALVRYQHWDDLDDFDSASILRKVSFRISVMVRGSDCLSRYELLNEIEPKVRSLITGISLAGSLPGLTRLRHGSFATDGSTLEQTLHIDGEYTYELTS